MKVRMLGSGGSGGVPLIGCRCAVCQSPDPRNRRLRVSIVVEGDRGQRILVDTSPDLRQQLKQVARRALWAQSHGLIYADHLHGLDDLRAVNFHRNAPLEIWADAATRAEMLERFRYAFNPPRTNAGIWYAPSLVAHEMSLGVDVEIAGMTVRAFTQIHGGDRAPTLGLRFGRFAYRPMCARCPRQPSRRWRGSIPGSSIACRKTQMSGIATWRRRWHGSNECGRVAPCSPIWATGWTTRRCAQSCLLASNRAMTALRSRLAEEPIDTPAGSMIFDNLSYATFV